MHISGRRPRWTLNTGCEKHILKKWNEDRRCSVSFYKLSRDGKKKSPRTPQRVTTWDTSHPPQKRPLPRQHFLGTNNMACCTHAKENTGWLHNLWTYTKCSCSAVGRTRYKCLGGYTVCTWFPLTHTHSHAVLCSCCISAECLKVIHY